MGGCKTVKGTDCQFPFKYKGKDYGKCTTMDNGNNPWCYTTKGNGNWANCLPSCPTDSGTKK